MPWLRPAGRRRGVADHLRAPRDRAIIVAVHNEDSSMEAVRRMARSCLRAVDALYRVRHGLRPVGPVLLVGRDRHDGPARRFPDGTELAPGAPIGTLHFDNARIAALDAETPNAIGLSFTRLLIESLANLAELARADGPYGDIAVFRGIGWTRQGERLGFVSEPFPEGRRKRFLAVHIGLLVWAFAPTRGTAIAARPEPRLIWLTRDTLLQRYGTRRRHERKTLHAAAGARAG